MKGREIARKPAESGAAMPKAVDTTVMIRFMTEHPEKFETFEQVLKRRRTRKRNLRGAQRGARGSQSKLAHDRAGPGGEPGFCAYRTKYLQKRAYLQNFY